MLRELREKLLDVHWPRLHRGQDFFRRERERVFSSVLSEKALLHRVRKVLGVDVLGKFGLFREAV